MQPLLVGGLSAGSENDVFVADEVPHKAAGGADQRRRRGPQLLQAGYRRDKCSDIRRGPHINDCANQAHDKELAAGMQKALLASLVTEGPAPIQEIAVEHGHQKRGGLDEHEIKASLAGVGSLDEQV